MAVPELEVLGMFGTELAVGKLWHGETGVEDPIDIKEGVAVRFWGVARRSTSPKILIFL